MYLQVDFLRIRFTYIRRLPRIGTRLVAHRNSVIITNNVKETDTIRYKFREGVEQAVRSKEAGEELDKKRQKVYKYLFVPLY